MSFATFFASVAWLSPSFISFKVSLKIEDISGNSVPSEPLERVCFDCGSLLFSSLTVETIFSSELAPISNFSNNLSNANFSAGVNVDLRLESDLRIFAEVTDAVFTLTNLIVALEWLLSVEREAQLGTHAGEKPSLSGGAKACAVLFGGFLDVEYRPHSRHRGSFGYGGDNLRV